jgi:hypothetical protein
MSGPPTTRCLPTRLVRQRARRVQAAVEGCMATAMRCACDQEGVPLCVACACLFSLIEAAVAWGTQQQEGR